MNGQTVYVIRVLDYEDSTPMGVYVSLEEAQHAAQSYQINPDESTWDVCIDRFVVGAPPEYFFDNTELCVQVDEDVRNRLNAEFHERVMASAAATVDGGEGER